MGNRSRWTATAVADSLITQSIKFGDAMHRSGILVAWGLLLAGFYVGLSTFASEARASRIIVGTYYEDTVNGSCNPDPGQKRCYFFFSAVPGSRSVLMNRVSCHLILTPAGATEPDISRLLLSTYSGGQIAEWRKASLVPRALTVDDAGLVYFAENDAIRLLFGPTQHPLIEVYTPDAAAVSANCIITGTVPAPI